MMGPVATIESPHRSPAPARTIGDDLGNAPMSQPRNSPAARAVAVVARVRLRDMAAESFRRASLGARTDPPVDRAARPAAGIVRGRPGPVQTDSGATLLLCPPGPRSIMVR